MVRIGACVPAAYAPVAAAMGYEYVEVPASDLCPERPEADFEGTARAIDGAGIPALAFNYLIPPDVPLVGPAVQRDRLAKYMQVASRRAASLGGQVFVLGSGPARRIPEGFPRDAAAGQFREFLAVAADAAAARGMVVAIEALNRTETNFLHTVEEALEYVEALRHPALGVLADIYHMHMESEPLRHLALAGDRLLHVQVCDQGRSAPGTRAMDIWAVFIFLNNIAYRGAVSVECRWESFEREGAPALSFVRSASRTSGLLAFAP